MNLNKITLYFNDKQINLPIGKMTFLDELYIDIQWKKEKDHQRLRIEIHPKEVILLKDLVVTWNYKFNVIDEVFCNGFQSWSESRTYKITEKIKPLKSFARPFFKYIGDQHLSHLTKNKALYSWTYGYIKNGRKLNFIGSLNEKTAFTFLVYDIQNNSINLHKECGNIQLNHSFPIIDIVFFEGIENDTFNRYFELMECPKPTAPPLLGWTSSHHFNKGISEDIIEKNITALNKSGKAVDMILIDDGYQKAVGDWLNIQKQFPNGIQAIVQKAKQHNYKSGIWMAPFICSKKSDIFKNKKNWLVKNKSGQPVKTGYNPQWGGWFYSLDFYNKEVQDYLLKVIHTMLHHWGFDLIKMDFLFSVCILPCSNKTSAQIMSDAIQYLRRQVGDKLFLASGVPLGAAFGLVDYCSVGSDIYPRWENKFLKYSGMRERVTTFSSLQSTISRWQLNGRAFNNYPGLFILSNEKNKLSDVQQNTLLLINILLGNVLFCSDFLRDYNDEQWCEWESIYYWRNSKIEAVDQYSKDVYFISFKKDNRGYTALCNLTNRKTKVKLFSHFISLEPHESMILKN